jgi:hypothetical protein
MTMLSLTPSYIMRRHRCEMPGRRNLHLARSYNPAAIAHAREYCIIVKGFINLRNFNHKYKVVYEDKRNNINKELPFSLFSP